MQVYNYILIPLIGGLIGWVTNWIAVKMLFRPRNPVNLGFMQLQGVFPKRQDAVARKVADLVVSELLTESDLKQKIRSRFSGDLITEKIDQRIKEFLAEKLPKLFPMMAMFLTPDILDTVAASVKPEVTRFIDEMNAKFDEGFESTLAIKETVYEKVKNFSSEKLEEVILAVMKKELVFVEYVGGVLGVLIGCIQLLIV